MFEVPGNKHTCYFLNHTDIEIPITIKQSIAGKCESVSSPHPSRLVSKRGLNSELILDENGAMRMKVWSIKNWLSKVKNALSIDIFVNVDHYTW